MIQKSIEKRIIELHCRAKGFIKYNHFLKIDKTASKNNHLIHSNINSLNMLIIILQISKIKEFVNANIYYILRQYNIKVNAFNELF